MIKMSKAKKETTDTKSDNVEIKESVKPSTNDIEWTDYVLGLLTDDEKISGNPTTDGLRRVFEIALDCAITQATSDVVQSPDPSNEKRATVVHTISYILKNSHSDNEDLKYRTVSGAADVYWGNCDKVYRNHPVAVAETRAEGRALRRALKLRKVVAAEELTENTEDHPDANSVNKITNNQINFIDVISQRLNINVSTLLQKNILNYKNIYDLMHNDAVDIIRLLSRYQQNIAEIPEDVLGYNTEWK